MDYYKEQALKELQTRKEKAEAFIEAWAGIKRLKTKDGKDFAEIGKNFRNKDGEKCIFANPYALRGSDDKIIKVYINTKLGGYDSDDFPIILNVQRYDEKREEYKKAGRLIDGGFLVDYVKMTPNEIENLIEQHIEYWQSIKKDCEKALEHFDEYSEKIIEMREEAKKYIEALPEHYIFKSIFDERR